MFSPREQLISSSQTFLCDQCKRHFVTERGRSIHYNTCKKRQSVSSFTQPARVDSVVNTVPRDITEILQKVWGDHSLADVKQILDAIYEEGVYWRRNLFLLPTGAAGKTYITETTRLIEIWNQKVDPLKDISIKAVMTMPMLLLQKPSLKSKAKDHSECLNRRLNLWVEGKFNDLMRESRTIQNKLPKPNSLNTSEQCAKNFAKLMLQGKVHAALRLLDDKMSGGILDLSDDTLKELQSKHSNPIDADESVLIKGDIPFIDPVMYNDINETTIMNAALRTKGAAGPSGINADGWRRILVSKNYGKTGTELRSSLARFAKKLCTKEIDHMNDESLEAYVACRLIPLDKKPGVRPIGVSEVLRRLIGKSIISVIKPEILESAGSLQLCAGLPGGCEAAAHAMTTIFEEEGTDTLLLVDATNAFNSPNRKVLLHNIRYICQAMSTYIRNCYGSPSRLFVMGGKEISSSEGTTQGDPFAMPAYAVGIVPLLPLLKNDEDSQNFNIKHCAYADDLGGAGKLFELRKWWDKVEHYGPLFGNKIMANSER